MLNWYKKVNKDTDFILQQIKKHPFIIELIEGNLSKNIFQFYIFQDAYYLSEYKKILALLGVKCNDPEDAQFFLDAATGIIKVEQVLHQQYLSNIDIQYKISPTSELYTSYLAKIVSLHSIEEGLAAVLPCFTIYKQVGDYILNEQTKKINHPYQNWINTYGGEDFSKSVHKAIEITNKYAQNASDETVKKMSLIFEKASKLEWMFWDSAYKQELWKI